MSSPLPGFWADNTVYDMVGTIVDGEPATVIGGSFRTIGDLETPGVALWRNGEFEPMGGGLEGSVYGLLASTFEPGVIYAAGTFEDRDGNPATRHGLMRWDGGSPAPHWQPLATVTHAYALPYGHAMVEFDDGSGPALYLVGTFGTVDGVVAPSIARFDGSSWSPVGVPVGSTGNLLGIAVYDSGDGARLYTCGTALPGEGGGAGGVNAWDGETWQSIALPFDDASLTGDMPFTMTVHDDGGGSGSQLYIAGNFPLLYRWNGASIETLGTVGANRRRLRVHDLGAGPKLVIAGFQGSTTPAISVWTGTAIMPIPGVLSFGSTLATDGHAWAIGSLPGGRLGIGGRFRWMNEVPGARPMANLAAYDPSAAPWVVDQPDDVVASVGELVEFHVGLFPDAATPPIDPVAYAWRRDGVPLLDGPGIAGASTATLSITIAGRAEGGLFDVIVTNDCGESVSDPALLTVTCPSDLDGDGVVGGADLGALLGSWGTSDAAADLNGDGVVDAADLGLLLAGWGAC